MPLILFRFAGNMRQLALSLEKMHNVVDFSFEICFHLLILISLNRVTQWGSHTFSVQERLKSGNNRLPFLSEIEEGHSFPFYNWH